MPLSKIFHVPVYRINQFYRLGNYGYLLKITGLPTVTDSLHHKKLYKVHINTGENQIIKNVVMTGTKSLHCKGTIKPVL